MSATSRRTLSRASGVEQVPLVADDHDRGAGRVDPFREPLVLVRHAFRRVDDEQRGVGAVDRFQRPHEAVVLGRFVDAALAPQAGSVDEAQRAVFGLDHGVDRVAVVPGMSCTTERSSPTRRLNNVDLPTLGRPTIAMLKMPSSAASASARAANSSSRLHRVGQRGDEGVEQFARQPAVNRRHRHRIAEAEPLERPDVGLAPLVVDLVRHHDHGRLCPLQQLGDLGVLVGDPGRHVDDEEHDIGHAHGLGRLRAHFRGEHRLLAREPGLALGEPPPGVDDTEARDRSTRRSARADRA